MALPAPSPTTVARRPALDEETLRTIRRVRALRRRRTRRVLTRI